MKDSMRYWWNNITGPAQLVDFVIDSITSNKSVLLCHNSFLPWYKEFSNVIADRIHDVIKEANVSIFNCSESDSDKLASDETIAIELTEKFGYADTMQSYRRAGRNTIQDHMISNKVLKNQIIVVRNLHKDTNGSWLKFLIKYKTNGINDGLFIVEAIGKNSDISLPNSSIADCKNYITYYDQLLFNNMLMANSKMSTEWKQYLALLTTLLCNGDVELGEYLINNKVICENKSPINSLNELFNTEEFKEKYNNIEIDASHPYCIMQNQKKELLKNKVWEAQLKLILPLIEEELIRFIEKYKTELEDSLQKDYICNSAGKSIDTVYDIEIGSLAYICSNHLHNMPFENKERIKLLRFLRNSIAHHCCCENKEISDFLLYYPFEWY